MHLTLYGYDSTLMRFAVTKATTGARNGRFFLDFDRKLKNIRRLGIDNPFFGPVTGMLVPVIHETQQTSGYCIKVTSDDPCFQYLRTLWDTHPPSGLVKAAGVSDSSSVLYDFMAQFPEDS